MVKVFGSTQYVKTEGEYSDVAPFEEYLQLEVKSQWDWNPNNLFLVYNNGFTYYVILAAKENTEKYQSYKKLKDGDMTEEYKQAIKNYLNE